MEDDAGHLEQRHANRTVTAGSPQVGSLPDVSAVASWWPSVLLVVIRYLNIVRIPVTPSEANALLIVNANAYGVAAGEGGIEAFDLVAHGPPIWC
jgi:hypothetical protein